MSDFWLGALLSAVIAAIVVPLVNHFLATKREQRSNIRVSISAHSFQMPRLLYDRLHPETAYDSKGDPKLREVMQCLCYLQSYIRVSIRNRSTSKLTGTMIRIHDDMDDKVIFQVGDMGALEGPKLTQIPIGDLMPDELKVAHIYCTFDLADAPLALLKRLLSVTADKFHTRSIIYPMPEYLYERHQPLSDKLATIARKWVGMFKA